MPTFETVLGRSDVGVGKAVRHVAQRVRPECQIHGSIMKQRVKGITLGGWKRALGRPCSMRVHLCAVAGGAKPVVAPLRPACKEAGGSLRQILCFGSIRHLEQTGPAGTSGTGRSPQIGYEGPLLRWIIFTRAWLGVANALVHRRFSWSAFGVRPGLSADRGYAAICLPRHL